MKFSPGFNKYFFNTSWLLGERIVRMITALFVGIYVARYLGPENFGLLSYAISFVGLFMALSTLGLDDIVIRELVKNPKRKNELLGTALGLKGCGVLIMWAGIAIALPLTDSDQHTTTLVAIIALASVFQTFNVIDFNYQAEVKAKLIVHAQLAQILVSSAFKLTLIAFSASLIWFAWAYLLDTLVLALGLLIIYIRNSGKIFSWRINIQTAKTFIKISWPLILSGMVISIYMRIDQVMIKEMLGAKEVGLYAAAVKLSEAWYFIPMAITSSFFPAIIVARDQNKKLYYQRLQQLYDLMVWMGVAIAIPTIFLAPFIIKFLYGEDYLGASVVLCIHIWTGVFVSLGVASGKWLLNENLQLFSFYRALLGAIINVALNLILIDGYGIYGAAIATLSAQISAAYLFDILTTTTRKMFFIKTLTFIYPLRIIKNYLILPSNIILISLIY